MSSLSSDENGELDKENQQCENAQSLLNCYFKNLEDLLNDRNRLVALLDQQSKMYLETKTNEQAARQECAALQDLLASCQNSFLDKVKIFEENRALHDKNNSLLLELTNKDNFYREKAQEQDKVHQALEEKLRSKIAQLESQIVAHDKQHRDNLKSINEQCEATVFDITARATNIEKEKNVEIARLQIEYDAKVSSLQEQISHMQLMGPQNRSRNDIFKKKAEQAKADYEEKIKLLNSTVADLQAKIELLKQSSRTTLQRK
jgi:hypothetical protein